MTAFPLIRPTITITVEAEGEETRTVVYQPGQQVRQDIPEILTNDGVKMTVDTNRRETGYEGLVEEYTTTTITWTTVLRRKEFLP
jgi:hypothetical protein